MRWNEYAYRLAKVFFYVSTLGSNRMFLNRRARITREVVISSGQSRGRTTERLRAGFGGTLDNGLDLAAEADESVSRDCGGGVFGAKLNTPHKCS